MRLSTWRKSAPTKESMNDRVLTTLKPVLSDLGADDDPECWVTWGDDPMRYSVLAPSVAGLISVAVRVGVADEAPRANGKLIRWPKLSVSELSVESSGGHRLVAVQVESLVLKGVDAEAGRVAEFVRRLIAGIDGRAISPVPIQVVQQIAAGVPTVAVAAPPKREPAPRSAAPATAVAAPAEPRPAVATPASGPTPKATPVAPKVAARRAPETTPPAPEAAPKPASKPAPNSAPSKPAAKDVPKLAGARKSSAAAAAAVPGTGAIALIPAVAGAPAATQEAPAPPAGKAMPIHSRATSGSAPRRGAAASKRPGPAPEPGVDREEWVSPHPIEEPLAREPNKPRPWTP